MKNLDYILSIRCAKFRSSFSNMITLISFVIFFQNILTKFYNQDHCVFFFSSYQRNTVDLFHLYQAFKLQNISVLSKKETKAWSGWGSRKIILKVKKQKVPAKSSSLDIVIVKHFLHFRGAGISQNYLVDISTIQCLSINYLKLH